MVIMDFRLRSRFTISRVAVLFALLLSLSAAANAQSDTATKTAPQSRSQANRSATSDAATRDFPPELVNWKAYPENPIFTAEGPGHWDVKIRERGWILREGDAWQLWFTGYDG